MTKTKTGPIIQKHAPRDGRDYDNRCARCGSDMDWVECENCDDDGDTGHDCDEDCCCCSDPVPNVTCDICHGRLGWWVCSSSEQWCQNHPLPGREKQTRGHIEWMAVEGENAAIHRTSQYENGVDNDKR